MHRRSIYTSYSLLHRRFHPSFAHILPHNDNDKAHSAPFRDPPRHQTGNFPQQQFNRSYSNAIVGFGVLFHGRGGTNSLPMDIGHSFRSYSSSVIGEGSDKVEYMSDPASVFAEGSDKVEYMSDPVSVWVEKGMEAAGISDPGSVLTEKGMEAVVSQAPVASEVAVAAADSFLPVAFLQYFIDGVHNLTGLNWWAAIALTTIFIRSATVPLLISQLKATSKLTQMRPHLEEIKQQMEASSDPVARLEAHKRMKELFNEYGVNPLTPLKGLFIQGPIFVSFFLAIENMVEKVPSFKGGGAFWFSDLTTPDSLYIFPVLTALTFWITVELNMEGGLEGNPVSGTMKKISRVFAVLAVPLTMTFPKAIFCYWITSNMFSLLYGLVIRRPLVRKLVDLPEIDLQPPTAMQPTFSRGFKPPSGESISAASADSQTPMNQPKPTDASIPSSSSSISQQIDNLERAVKGRKKT